MKRDHRSHSKFGARCINMFVIFIVWDSFGKQGHPCHRITVSAKVMNIASSGNIRWPISRDFKLDIIKMLCTNIVPYANNKLVHSYSWLEAQNMLVQRACVNICIMSIVCIIISITKNAYVVTTDDFPPIDIDIICNH